MGKRGKHVYLTGYEMTALLAAAQNIDPCMFDEMGDPEGTILRRAWERGLTKLRNASYLDEMTGRLMGETGRKKGGRK